MKQHFHREDIDKIVEVLKQFPDAGSFQLEIVAESGIGTTGAMIIPTVVNGMYGDFRVEIWGTETW